MDARAAHLCPASSDSGAPDRTKSPPESPLTGGGGNVDHVASTNSADRTNAGLRSDCRSCERRAADARSVMLTAGLL
jgi:hypothetical protein